MNFSVIKILPELVLNNKNQSRGQWMIMYHVAAKFNISNQPK